MVNMTGVNLCPPPFVDSNLYLHSQGYTEGRLCQKIADDLKCCLPCPMTDWIYPDNFNSMTVMANWVAAVSAMCCVYLLASWAALPVDKTNRHYLSVCLTFGVLLMNLGFVMPLAAHSDQCYDKITPHGMSSSKVCGASGSLLLLGGWCGVMWAFLRSLSLHLQICWQVLVGRSFMIFAHAAGWGIPLLGITLALVFSGVSFRFGPMCHLNHKNSLADVWVPLLIFAGATVIITFATFGYCVKVYLASLYDNSSSTEGSSLPAYTNSVRTVSPRQAYRRVKRVIALQWRGIAIVLIIIADVIFFSVIFVFQDNIVQSVTNDPSLARDWVICLIGAAGDKNQCLEYASSLVVRQGTVMAVLLLLGLNGIWLMFLLGRISMFTGWYELFVSLLPGSRTQKEFVSVDARHETKKDLRNSLKSPPVGRRTPDYFGQTARYSTPVKSFSSPRVPQTASWDHKEALERPERPERPQRPERPDDQNMNPLGMNRI